MTVENLFFEVTGENKTFKDIKFGFGINENVITKFKEVKQKACHEE